MNGVTLSILAFCVFSAVSLLCPAKAEATELDSIYVRVPISPERYQAWLASPLRHAGEFDDWSGMSDQWKDEWREDFYDWDLATNGEFVDLVQQQMTSVWNDDWNSQPYIDYDQARAVLTYAQILYDENFINFANDLSAFRSLADFKDTDEPGFIAIYPFIWDPGYTVIMEIGAGCTKFHTEATVPPAFKRFIEEANAHFDTELEKMEDDG